MQEAERGPVRASDSKGRSGKWHLRVALESRMGREPWEREELNWAGQRATLGPFAGGLEQCWTVLEPALCEVQGSESSGQWTLVQRSLEERKEGGGEEGREKNRAEIDRARIQEKKNT